MPCLQTSEPSSRKAHTMKLTRLLSSLLAAVFFCVTAAVAADAYPSRPVRLMVPYPLADFRTRSLGCSAPR